MRRLEVNRALKIYSDALIPPTSYVDGGTEAVQRVCNELRSRSGIIDRCFLGGSIGKKTAADPKPDFDVAVFVNNYWPPFSLVLDHFETILSSSIKLPDLRVEGKTAYSLKLKFLGYDIDLLPASNYVLYSAQQAKSPVRDARQALGVLQKIQADSSNNWYAFSSSLEETQLRFPREQSGFVHDLVRLCKAWNKTILQMGDISGRSTLIELIAIHAGQQEERRGSPALVTGFESFLRLMINFQNLDIDFHFDPLEPIRQETVWKPNVPGSVRRRPFVLEPANPFNNLAAGVSKEQMTRFQRAASGTLELLNSLQSQIGGII